LSAYHIVANQLRTTQVLAVKTDSPTVKTLTFKDIGCARAQPGQFVMLWIPGVDEIPLSILDAEEDLVSTAIKKAGEATEALHKMKVGDHIGVRGPFGNSFTLVGGKILMVGGGTGTVPMLFLAKKLALTPASVVVVLGAKTGNELLFRKQFEEILGKKKGRLVISTEDGSCGITGLCTTPVEKILTTERFDMIYACGPEQMMLKVFETAEKRRTNLEASLERLMRCAIGLCGSCTIGRYRVCTDGPVFSLKQLREVENEFGISKRDFDGRKTAVN
jgi:dihydroorotate dehydrogenase electron transfer subunit